MLSSIPERARGGFIPTLLLYGPLKRASWWCISPTSVSVCPVLGSALLRTMAGSAGWVLDRVAHVLAAEMYLKVTKGLGRAVGHRVVDLCSSVLFDVPSAPPGAWVNRHRRDGVKVGGPYGVDPVREGKDALGLTVDAKALYEGVVLLTIMVGHLGGADQVHQPYGYPHAVLHVERERTSGCPVVLTFNTRLQPTRQLVDDVIGHKGQISSQS